MNADRWRNIAHARNAYLGHAPEVDAYPIEAFFEVAARCNLRCQMCAINFDARYRGRGERPPFLTRELFDRLAPIFPTLHRAFLFGLGEPVLNPDLVAFIDVLAAKGVEVCFNTNATLVTETMADAIARAGAAHVTVSIDGASAATYETIRRGAKFDDVVRGIRALVSARERFGRPQVDFAFVGMASNIHELPSLVELAATLGATAIHVEPLLGQSGSADLDDHYARENLGSLETGSVTSFLAEAAELAQQHSIRLGSRLLTASQYDYVSEARAQRAPKTACSEPWASIWVTSSGEVRTCCMNDTSFGNLFDESFDDIWNGERFRAFRLQHARREAATGCANCVRNGRVRNSTFFRPTQPVTYRPYFESFPASAADDPVSLSAPAPQSTAIDTILVDGALARRADAGAFELMLEQTPVANLGMAEFVDASRFRMTLALPYLTEGSHVMWVRRTDGSSAGWSHRDFYFWRP